jgi:hypothetical protein
MHYKNDREAHVGDPVVGKGYNYGNVAGILLSITPGSATCNCIVGCLKTVPMEKHFGLLVALKRDTNGGQEGNINAVVYQEEYSQCDNLYHADDVMELLGMIGSSTKKGE